MMPIFLCVFGITIGLPGIGLLIAEIVDECKARKAKREGLLVYRYPF